MIYRELLPDGCSPEDAEDVSEPRFVFRLVRNCPPTDEDFKSQRAESPNRPFRGVSECRARGLSVHEELCDSTTLLKLPSHKGKCICRVQLNTDAGRIQQTGRYSHHTWWPLAGFNIIGNCPLVRE